MRKEWMNPDNLNFDNITDYVLYVRHKKAYDFIKDKIKDKKILEIGCGSGFGSNILIEYANEVYAIDIDPDAIEKAQNNNKNNRINFFNGDVLKGLPFSNNEFDFVVCFQVFEHIEVNKTQLFLSEIERVLKKSGVLFLTTPNRQIRLLPFQKPTNKYHKKEYSATSLEKSINRVFNNVKILGLRAREDIEKIEYHRVKQNYFYTFIKKPLKSILNIKPKSNAVNNKKTDVKSKIMIDSITTNDFFLVEKEIDKSLDLYAICSSNSK